MIEQFISELLFDSSSSSSDDDEEEDLTDPLALDEDTNKKRKKPKIEHLELETDKYSDEAFREIFRMNKNTFNYILNIIKPNLKKQPHYEAGKQINAETQLLLALWYFATPDSHKSISTKFNVSKDTAHQIVQRITGQLLVLAPRFIIWPVGAYLERVLTGFQRIGFPNTIGCIDVTYIKIPLVANEHEISYICRENYPAIILQGVCDNRLLFTHCYAGEVGSLHNVKVLRNSEVWEYITSNQKIQKFPNDTHLLGNETYPCLPQLLTPFSESDGLTKRQRKYNFKLSTTRQAIDRAFRLLKLRWRCLLTALDGCCIDWIPKYVMACCVLHNICILQNDVMNVDDLVEPQNKYNLVEGLLRQAGEQKRQHILINNVL